jgi:hypothetical protein
MATAVLSSINAKNLDGVLLTVTRATEGEPPPARLVGSLLRLVGDLGQRGATVKLLAAVGTPEKGKYAAWQFAALASLLDGLDQRGSSPAGLRDGNAELKEAVGRLDGLFAAARAAAADVIAHLRAARPAPKRDAAPGP